jgi:hypothetical protein
MKRIDRSDHDPRVSALMERAYQYYLDVYRTTGRAPVSIMVTAAEYALLQGSEDVPRERSSLYGMRVMKPQRLDVVRIRECALAMQALADIADRVSARLVAAMGVHQALLGTAERRPAGHVLPIADSDESSDVEWEVGVHAMLADVRVRHLARDDS